MACRHSTLSRRAVRFIMLYAIAVVMGIAHSLSGFANGPQGETRKIVSEDFTKHRQEASSAGSRTSPQSPRTPSGSSTAPKGTANSSQAKHNRVYRYASSSGPKTRPSSAATAGSIEQLGITLWRLRPSKAGDSGTRMLVREKGKSSEWTPERVEADTPFREGDHIRLSIESPRAGYLYVVDRDLYADGSMGDAMLIFPELDIRGGDNRVSAGKLIDIPAQEDEPNYFTARPGRSDQIGEVLSIIVTTAPLDLQIGYRPLPISASEIANWEKTWASETERFEMEGGAGQTWTKEEKEAAAGKSTRPLTQDEPSPQTIYRVPRKDKAGFLINVRLSYGK
jgi:Domain of unknown function (DUF4384)